jgi:hypothetical protein
MAEWAEQFGAGHFGEVDGAEEAGVGEEGLAAAEGAAGAAVLAAEVVVPGAEALREAGSYGTENIYQRFG